MISIREPHPAARHGAWAAAVVVIVTHHAAAMASAMTNVAAPAVATKPTSPCSLPLPPLQLPPPSLSPCEASSGCWLLPPMPEAPRMLRARHDVMRRGVGAKDSHLSVPLLPPHRVGGYAGGPSAEGKLEGDAPVSGGRYRLPQR